MAANDLSELVIMPGKDYIDICNAVRSKTGQSGDLVSGELPMAIQSIVSNSGIDTSQGTAVENDIAQGAVAFVKDKQVVGNIPFESYVDTNAAIEWDETSKKIILYSYPKNRIIIGTEKTYIEDGEEQTERDYAELSCPGRYLGNATVKDVKQGVTFTSQNGLELIGEMTMGENNNSSNIFTAYTTGTLVQEQDTGASSGIEHDLDQTPNFYYIYTEADLGQETNYLISAIGMKMYNNSWAVCSYKKEDQGKVVTTSTVNTFFASSTHFNVRNSSIKFKAGITYKWIVGII